MKVYGTKIPPEALAEVTRCITGCQGFTYRDVIGLFSEQGINAPAVSQRAADRFLQKMRKKGQIEFAGGHWYWVGA